MSIRQGIRTEFAHAGFYRVYAYSRALGVIYKKKGLWVADASDLDEDIILGEGETVQDALEFFIDHFDEGSIENN